MRGAALVAVLLAVLLARPAAAQEPLLAPEDATDLANGLADAQAQQGICYGWRVVINGTVTDVGSSTGGPDRPIDAAQCPRGSAALEADLLYTCDSCEEEDSARVAIRSDLRDPPTTEDLERLGYDAGDLLSETADDVALIAMTGALPLLAAERGNADFVDYELPEQMPATDRPTGSPGSDFLRDAWPQLALCAFLLLLGPVYWHWKRRTDPT